MSGAPPCVYTLHPQPYTRLYLPIRALPAGANSDVGYQVG